MVVFSIGCMMTLWTITLWLLIPSMMISFASTQRTFPTTGNVKTTPSIRIVPPTIFKKARTPYSGDTYFPVPRGTRDSISRPFTMRGTLPDCSECFGHGVNKSVDPRCEYGCTGSKISTQFARTFENNRKFVSRPDRRIQINKGFGKGKKEKKTFGKYGLKRFPQRSLPVSQGPRQYHIPTVKSTGKIYTAFVATSNNGKLKFGKMMINSGNQRVTTTAPGKKGKKALPFGQPSFGALKNKKDHEEKVLKRYRRYLTTSTIVLVVSICAAVIVTSIIAYIKHGKKKRKIHSFRQMSIA